MDDPADGGTRPVRRRRLGYGDALRGRHLLEHGDELCSVTSSETDQDVHCETCTFSGPLDFANKAYYVLATVAKTATGVDPRLYALAIY